MRKLLVALLLAAAFARFGQVAYTGLTYSIGDFYTTLPGAYVEWFNPTLWASPDLTDVLGKAPAYRRGPSQYLTFLPFALLDSYRTIARVLLAVFALLIIGSAVVMWRTFGQERRDPTLLALVLSSSLLYYPTLQAYVAREFEVFILAGTVLLFAAALGGRGTAAGAITAYLALYKYLPLAVLPWMVARRWWRALAGFAIAAAVILLAAHALFGLQNFSSDGFVQGYIRNLLTVQSTYDFCYSFEFLRYTQQSHDVSLRFGLCGLNERLAFPVPVVYLAIVLTTFVVLGYGFFRLERAAPLPPEQERWRRTWELSAVVIAYMTFFYTHYYYLMILIVPLTAVMVHAYQRRSTRLWLLWGSSYLLLSAFLIPWSAVMRWLEFDAFTWYLKTFLYLPGELILLATVLYEYTQIGRNDASTGV